MNDQFPRYERRGEFLVFLTGDKDFQGELKISFFVRRFAVAFTQFSGTDPLLMKHGAEDTVLAWADKARKAWLAQDSDLGRKSAEALKVVIFPEDFPEEELNRIVQISGYLREALTRAGLSNSHALPEGS